MPKERINGKRIKNVTGLLVLLENNQTVVHFVCYCLLLLNHVLFLVTYVLVYSC